MTEWFEDPCRTELTVVRSFDCRVKTQGSADVLEDCRKTLTKLIVDIPYINPLGGSAAMRFGWCESLLYLEFPDLFSNSQKQVVYTVKSPSIMGPIHADVLRFYTQLKGPGWDKPLFRSILSRMFSQGKCLEDRRHQITVTDRVVDSEHILRWVTKRYQRDGLGVLEDTPYRSAMCQY